MLLPSRARLFQPPRRDKALAAEGVEQKAIMQGAGKQPQTDSALKQALSHPRRLEMLGYLAQKKGAGTDEAELVEALGLSASRVRYHLLVLSNAGLIAHLDDQELGRSDRFVAAASASL